MNPFGPFGNMFPYTNFHSMNLDWVIQVAKDFLDQYTTIQETITEGMEELTDKKDELEALLDAWYQEHSEDIANDLADALQDLNDALTAKILEFDTAADAKGAEVIASIPANYTALSRAVNAYLCISAQQKITYNYSTKTITFPAGCYCIYNGVPYSIVSSISLDVTSHLQTDSCNLWMLSDRSIIAEKFNLQPSDTSAKFLGSIYDKNIYINGVAPNFIKIIYADSIENSLFVNNNGSFIGIEEEIRTVVVNRNTKKITFPGGFKVYRGKTYSYSQTAISYTDNTATKIWMKNNGDIYCTTWNDNDIWHADDDCIGYFYYDTVYIAGIPQSAISVIETNNSNSVFVFGDSIPAGTNTTKNFTQILHSFNKLLHYYNYAQGGTGYVREYTGTAVAGDGTEANGSSTSLTGDNNIYKQIQAVDGSLDNILIMAGTNDWSFGVDISTFRAAVDTALSYAQTKTQKILVVLPIKRENWATANNSQGLKLADYCNEIKASCIERGIAYYEGFEIFLNPSVAGIKTTFVPDGLHPNLEGHKRIARALYETAMQAYGR